jgi:hypothetical protein
MAESQITEASESDRLVAFGPKRGEGVRPQRVAPVTSVKHEVAW